MCVRTSIVVAVQLLPQRFTLPLETGKLERFIDGTWRRIHLLHNNLPKQPDNLSLNWINDLLYVWKGIYCENYFSGGFQWIYLATWRDGRGRKVKVPTPPPKTSCYEQRCEDVVEKRSFTVRLFSFTVSLWNLHLTMSQACHKDIMKLLGGKIAQSSPLMNKLRWNSL